MPYHVEILADSISAYNHRPMSYKLIYPRMVHSELLTHRVFSRSASSSRAIPIKKMIQDVIDNPAMPVFWAKAQKGMSVTEEVENKMVAIRRWLDARDAAVAQARILNDLGLAKGIVNRVLEPFGHINVVITSTDWANFYALRNHKDAQPEIRFLADLMLQARNASTPRFLERGQWHLPYIRQDDLDRYEHASPEERISNLLRISTARCARTSYTTFESKNLSEFDEDIKLYGQLVENQPLHASPAEHQATPDWKNEDGSWANPSLHGNFRGFIQFRKTLPNEFVMDEF